MLHDCTDRETHPNTKYNGGCQAIGRGDGELFNRYKGSIMHNDKFQRSVSALLLKRSVLYCALKNLLRLDVTLSVFITMNKLINRREGGTEGGMGEEGRKKRNVC